MSARTFQLYACPGCGEPAPRGVWRWRCGCGIYSATAPWEGLTDEEHDALPQRKKWKTPRLARVVECVPKADLTATLDGDAA